LTETDIEQVLQQALDDPERGLGGRNIILPDDTRKMIAQLVNGDARRSLNLLEMMADIAEVDSQGKRTLTPALLAEISGERS
ncbi:recombination factor protein RarA, partial [Escherichia coli]